MSSEARATPSAQLQAADSSTKSLDFHSIASKFPGHQKVNSPWPILAAAVISATSQWDESVYLRQLWDYLIIQHPPQITRVQIARRLREGFLKIAPLIGFARGINVLGAWASVVRKATPAVQDELEKDKPLRKDFTADALEARGKDFFHKIYERHTEKILANMAKISGGDLDVFVYVAIYGELMAETSIVDEKDTVLLEFVICFATLAGPQAKGHFFGSRNVGNGKSEMQGTLEMMRELYRQLDVPFPDGVEKYGMTNFSEKVKSWS